MILREHRPKPQGFADLLNWAALVGEGIVVNKDGSFLAGWTYTGPDLDAATAEELALLSQHFNQALLPLGDEWLLNADAIRRPSRDYPPPALGCGSILHGITFAFDSADIRPDSDPVLSAQGNRLRARRVVRGTSSRTGAPGSSS